MAYRMILNETSYFGPGSISCIVDEVKKRGALLNKSNFC